MRFRVIVTLDNGHRYASGTVDSYRQAYHAVVELLGAGYDAYVEHVFPGGNSNG